MQQHAQSTTLASENARKPNFVIILADDLGYGDLGCYGNTLVSTPHLDWLAREGMLFTDFHSTGAVCSPTRASLMTGRYQQRAGIPNVLIADPKHDTHDHGLHSHEITFPKLLKKAGYTTAIFGKWHLGYHRKYNPIHHGFDQFRGFVSGNVDYISHVNQAGAYDWWYRDQQIEEDGYTTHVITHYAMRFIEANKDRPFCLYLAHAAVHYPYQGPHDPPERTRYGSVLPGRQDKKQAYLEMTEELDRSVGQVVAALRRFHLEERTLVFFFSDNGAVTNVGSNGALRGHKGTVWEGGHRVPAVAYWPGFIKPGTVCDELAMNFDLMPTMLSLAGVSLPADHRLDGCDLSSAVLENQPVDERTLFWEHAGSLAARQGPWKLVRTRSGEIGLFNLDRDLGERDNLASQYPDRVRQMLTDIEAWQQEVSIGATVQPQCAH